VSPTIRKLPTPSHSSIPLPAPVVADGPARASAEPEPVAILRRATTHRSVVAPLSPERYKVQFTVDAATFQKLRRAQDLMRHRVPDGDVAAIFEQAVTMLVEHLERTKLSLVRRPREPRPVDGRSRTIPAAVRRVVWARDDGRCAFVGSAGRCSERGFLEFHHARPLADGGPASVDNIELRCRAHNQHEADRYFGADVPLLVRERAEVYDAVDA
jgi:5-methylcytosine-specific restriction endonuclease McrA